MSSFEDKLCNTGVEEALPSLTALSSQASSRRSCYGAAAVLTMSIFVITLSPFARSQELSLATATPTPPQATAAQENPFAQLASHRKPIPLRWKVAMVLAVIIIGSASLWISMRVWQSSNLFDRQYRFPQVATAPLRLGANRSGGHMAAITFRDRDRPKE